MKKILLMFWILSGLFMGLSQAPEKMSYQAIVRNGSGQLLINQGIAIKVSLLQGSPAGTLSTLSALPEIQTPTVLLVWK
jgi:hypothetical protein